MREYNRLSRYRIERIMRCFCADLTAAQTALLLGLNRKTVNRYFGRFRAAIAARQERDKATFVGVVEVDESVFGAERIRGRPGPRKRGRGTLKQPVFGIFERGGRVYTEVVPDAKAKTLQDVIRGKIALDAVLMSDGWSGCNGLVDVGYDKHLRINKSKHFAENGVHSPRDQKTVRWTVFLDGRDRELLELHQAPAGQVQRRQGQLRPPPHGLLFEAVNHISNQINRS